MVFRWIVGFLGFVVLAGSLGLAHDFPVTACHMTLTDTGFRLQITHDLDAMALGVSSQQDSKLLAERLANLETDERDRVASDLRALLRQKVSIRFDAQPASWEISFPDQGQDAGESAKEPSYFGVIALIEGKIPESASHLTFSAALGEDPVHLALENTRGVVGVSILLDAGQTSPDIPLARALNPPGALEIAGRYVYLGFWHILPKGLDHILFVLGLFLICRKWEPLFWQVTAFTLAHTVTLGLSALGVFSLPGRIVEPLIALSIVYVAVENIVFKEVKPHRLVIVFLFGLLHGLGFAGVLGELGLPGRQSTLALFSFNFGVELGQLSVIGVAYLLVGRFRDKDYYRARVVAPVSILIAAFGLFWTITRLL